MLVWHNLALVTLTYNLQSTLSKTIKIDGSKYHLLCSILQYTWSLNIKVVEAKILFSQGLRGIDSRFPYRGGWKLGCNLYTQFIVKRVSQGPSMVH